VDFFFDTSAVAKLYHQESASERLAQLVAGVGHRLYVSRLAVVELASVAAIKVRTGAINDSEADAIIGQLSIDVTIGDILVRRIHEDDYSRAAQLLTSHARKSSLRTLGALHLATAMRHQQSTKVDYFVTADRALAKVAELEGFTVFNPDLAP